MWGVKCREQWSRFDSGSRFDRATLLARIPLRVHPKPQHARHLCTQRSARRQSRSYLPTLNPRHLFPHLTPQIPEPPDPLLPIVSVYSEPQTPNPPSTLNPRPLTPQKHGRRLCTQRNARRQSRAVETTETAKSSGFWETLETSELRFLAWFL